jgi:hypothetical protein
LAQILDSADRLTVTRVLETGKIWLVQYTITALSIAVAFIVLSANKPKIFKRGRLFVFLIVAILCVYWWFYIKVGSRRELMIFLLALSVLVFARFNIKLKSLLLVMLPLSVLVLALGAFRQDVSDSQMPIQEFLINVFGEFVFPQFSLFYFIEESSDKGLLYGGSYLMSPLYPFGSLTGYTGLAKEFAIEYSNSGMGYGFTPAAEGFLNFHYTYIIFVPIIFSFILSLSFRIKGLSFWVPIVLLSFSLDFNRGEFASLFFQLLIFTLLISVFIKIFSVKLMGTKKYKVSDS